MPSEMNNTANPIVPHAQSGNPHEGAFLAYWMKLAVTVILLIAANTHKMLFLMACIF